MHVATVKGQGILVISIQQFKIKPSDPSYS